MEIQAQLILHLLMYRDTDNLLSALVSGMQPSAQLLQEFTQQDYLLGQDATGTYGTDDQKLVGYDVHQGKGKTNIFQCLYQFGQKHLSVTKGAPMCRYRHLLSWHELTRFLGEDLFTTSFLAKTDLEAGNSVSERTFFQWPAYLNHDNQSLNQLMQKKVSELHAHLKGSTLNFELSWLSLMNQVCGRRKAFRDLAKDTVSGNPLQRGGHAHDLYMLVTIAACIRLQLYRMLTGIPSTLDEAYHQLCRFINMSHSDYAATERRQLQSSIDVIRHQYGCHYVGKTGTEVPDYAIPANQEGLLSVLTGERWFLYAMFRQAYDAGSQDSYYKLLFYLYLHIKTLFRNELIQTNPRIGFHNFSIYEQRKEYFIPEGSVYEHLMNLLALGTFLNDHPEKRYMEYRLKPKNSTHDNFRKLHEMRTYLYFNPYGVDTKHWQHALIYHFIKTEDKKIIHDLPRHQPLRREVKLQAKAICKLHQEQSELCDVVVGIDAANSEIYCRPEVFAQAFRYLRSQSNLHTNRRPLGVTYHVGEDFYDMVSGLRAVSEVLRFLGFRANDRLGHALVLGTDVKTYYEKRHYEVRATKHELLDNAVWLYFQGQKIAGSEPVCHFLYDYAHRHFLEIYQEAHFDINDYFDAWLLRGDAPEYYLQNHDALKPLSSYMFSLDPWQRYALNDYKKATAARENPQARYLYAMYHYNHHVREEGGLSTTFRLPCHIRAAFVTLLEQVQQRLLTKIERLHIAIECNPTSNYKIGEMERYDEHPILKFYNFGIHTPYPHHEVSVSINTDDAGIFATSLEREYALMALALEKRQDEAFGNTPRAVVEWLNNIRKMSVEQRFVH